MKNILRFIVSFSLIFSVLITNVFNSVNWGHIQLVYADQLPTRTTPLDLTASIVTYKGMDGEEKTANPLNDNILDCSEGWIWYRYAADGHEDYTLVLDSLYLLTEEPYAIVTLPADTTIETFGVNTIKSTFDGFHILQGNVVKDTSMSNKSSIGILANGDLTFQGDGELNITSGKVGRYGITASPAIPYMSCAVYIEDGGLTVEGGILNFAGNMVEFNSGASQSVISCGLFIDVEEGKDINIKGGALNAVGNDASNLDARSAGIWVQDSDIISYPDYRINFTIHEGAAVIATGGDIKIPRTLSDKNRSGYSVGLYCQVGDLTLLGGRAEFTGGNSDNIFANSYGFEGYNIYGLGSTISVYGGELIANGGNIVEAEAYSGGAILQASSSVGLYGVNLIMHDGEVTCTGGNYSTGDSVQQQGSIIEPFTSFTVSCNSIGLYGNFDIRGGNLNAIGGMGGYGFGSKGATTDDAVGNKISGGTCNFVGGDNAEGGASIGLAIYGLGAYSDAIALTIEGGTINAIGNDIGMELWDGVFNINGGTITASSNCNGISINTATCNITDGTIVATAHSGIESSGLSLVFTSFRMTGGNILAKAGYGERSIGLYSEMGSVDIDGGKITASGGDASEQSIGFYSGYAFWGGEDLEWYFTDYEDYIHDITINGGIIDVSGGAAPDSYGTFIGLGGISINGGELTTVGGMATNNSVGLYKGTRLWDEEILESFLDGYSEFTEDIIVNDGMVSALGGISDNSHGVYTNVGNVTVNGGLLKSEASGAVEQSYGVTVKSNLNMNNGKIVTTGGHSENRDSRGVYTKNKIFMNGGRLVANSYENYGYPVWSKDVVFDSLGVTYPIGGRVVDYNGNAIVKTFTDEYTKRSILGELGELGGTAIIDGTTKYGGTLSADTALVITDIPEAFVYQWKLDDTDILNSTSDIYTPVVSDIGKEISYTITSTVETGSVLSNSITVLKADRTAPDIEEDDDNNVVLRIDNTMEYSFDGSVWVQYDSTSPPVLSGDTTVYVRYSETETYYASDSISLNFTEPKVIGGTAAIIGTPEPDETLSLDLSSLLTEYPDDLQYQWQTDGTDNTGASTLTYVPVLSDVGKEISCIITSAIETGYVIAESVTIQPKATEAPTEMPTEAPIVEPTAEPTEEPTAKPTETPTTEPTEEPTTEPTAKPTETPTTEPTAEPTAEPTEEPTTEPTAEPTEESTTEPTAEPTEEPTEISTEEPTPTETPRSSGGGGGGIVSTPKPTDTPLSEQTPRTDSLPTDDLVSESHIAYINGYPNGLFIPDGDITRAEASVMLNGLLEDVELKNNKTFPDLVQGAWYTKAVEVLASKGLLVGYPDGEFKPSANMTRAEFVTMIVPLIEDKAGSIAFTDVGLKHWAFSAINTAVNYGYVVGYPDGTFRPSDNITRAEAVRIFNVVFNRSADINYINKEAETIRLFPDIHRDFWAFYEIIEASNTHDYIRREDEETWHHHGSNI